MNKQLKGAVIIAGLTLTIFACSKDDTKPTGKLPTDLILKSIPAQTFTMGSNSIMGSPAQQAAGPEHQVTLDRFEMSEAEITNAQYVEFLNKAYTDGLIEITTSNAGPDNGKRLVTGTATSSYNGKVLYTLDGTRVLKDHNNDDGDDDPFTGEIEPENPLNISYVDFNSTTHTFYVKNPHNVDDCNWLEICNYQNYGITPRVYEGPVLNDFDDWAGSGQNFSNELQGWSATNPYGAVDLPTQAEVSNWPVTFIRWWGAKAFADYYGLDLPTEAQWECAAKAGQNFQYSVYDGQDYNDANWNKLGMGTVALGHVWESKKGNANPYGLYNLAGNAWEWIKDNYTEPLSTDAASNPLIEVANSTLRCWRGGSWNYHQATLQSAIRFNDEENRGNDHFGFRVVKNN